MYSEKRSSGKKKIQKIVNDNGTVTVNQPLRFYLILCIILDKTNNILCLLNDKEINVRPRNTTELEASTDI